MSEQNPDIIDVVDTTDKEQHTFQADAASNLKAWSPTLSTLIERFSSVNCYPIQRCTG